MNRFWLSSLLLALAVGCGQNNSPPVTNNSDSETSATAAASEPLPEGVVLVTLELPEMT